MAGFGFSLPKLPSQALTDQAPLSLADKLMMFGAVAKGHPEMAMQIPLMAQARDTFQRQQAATADLAQMVSGKPIPSRASMVKALDPANAGSVGADGSYTGAGADAPDGGGVLPIPRLAQEPPLVPRRDPSADAAGGPVSVRSALPMLSRLARAGGNVEPWTKMLEAAQPKALTVNGRVLDEHNPDIYGGYYGEAPTKGAEPVYDGNGRQVGWHMSDGAIQAITDATRATAGATKAGELPYAGPTAEATAAGTARGKAPFELVTKDVGGVPTTMTTQQALELAGGGGAVGGKAGAPGVAAPVGAGGASGRLDPQAFYKGFVLKHEGGLNPSDLNGAPTMYGFNQTANPDIDVHKLTPDTAAQRFADKYFAQSGAADLPAPLAAVHADTYFINPKKAQAILAQSGGDPGKYMDLREAWLNGLVQTQPGATKYAKAWATRNADLRATAQQLGGGPDAAPAPAAAASAGTPGFHGINATDQKTVDEAKADALQAEDVSRQGHQFQDLNKQQATGPGFRPFHIPIPFLDKVDLNVPGALARQYQTGVPAMENLSMRLATGLRAPGQRLTQAEIMKNLETVPNLRNLPAQNDTAISGYDDRAATKRAYANFISDWLSQKGSLQGADQAWAQQQGAGQGGGSPARAPAAKTPPMKAQPMQQIRLKSGGTATVVPVG